METGNEIILYPKTQVTDNTEVFLSLFFFPCVSFFRLFFPSGLLHAASFGGPTERKKAPPQRTARPLPKIYCALLSCPLWRKNLVGREVRL